MNLNNLKKKIVPTLKRYGIKKAGIFGSFARGEEKANSDLDLLVEIGKKDVSLLDFIEIKQRLEKLLNRKVDLVEYSTIKPMIRNDILAEELSIL